jgi:hypothetical protein
MLKALKSWFTFKVDVSTSKVAISVVGFGGQHIEVLIILAVLV